MRLLNFSPGKSPPHAPIRVATFCEDLQRDLRDMNEALSQLKHLPRTLLPDPGRFLPEPDRLQAIEARLGITIGLILAGLGTSLLFRWIPLPIPPLSLMCLLAGATALVFGFGVWRSRHYHEHRESKTRLQTEAHAAGDLYGEFKEEGNLWLWGWAVAAQFLAGLTLLITAVLVL